MSDWKNGFLNIRMPDEVQKGPDPIEVLRDEALNRSGDGSEKLRPESFEANDSYKVCYRLLANMCSRWKEIGLDHFPEENEAIELAKKINPYFVQLFLDDIELAQFKGLHDSMSDVWREMSE